jgi:hypothetical protein
LTHCKNIQSLHSAEVMAYSTVQFVFKMQFLDPRKSITDSCIPTHCQKLKLSLHIEKLQNYYFDSAYHVSIRAIHVLNILQTYSYICTDIVHDSIILHIPILQAAVIQPRILCRLAHQSWNFVRNRNHIPVFRNLGIISVVKLTYA